MLAPLPVSRATNSYDLLDELCALIEAEPRRFCLTFAFTRYRDARPIVLGGLDHPALVPACGTVACYGGWLNVLLWPHDPTSRPLCRAAERVAGGAGPVATELEAMFFDFQPFHGLTYGTPAYAARAVQRLRDFMARHEAALRATDPRPPRWYRFARAALRQLARVARLRPRFGPPPPAQE